MAQRLPRIDVGFHVFLRGEEEECGAVREVRLNDRTLLVSIENGGDHELDFDAVEDVVEEKVILDPARLEPRLLELIAGAHAEEDYPPPDPGPPPETGTA